MHAGVCRTFSKNPSAPDRVKNCHTCMCVHTLALTVCRIGLKEFDKIGLMGLNFGAHQKTNKIFRIFFTLASKKF